MDVQREDDDRRCGLPSVLLGEIGEGLVRGRDFVMGRGLFFRSGIRRSCGSGRLVVLTCELQLILRAVAIISTNKGKVIHHQGDSIRPLGVSKRQVR